MKKNKYIYRLLRFFTIIGFYFSSLVQADINDDLLNLNLEQILDSEITSVSRKSQNVLHAPAAVTIITREDIKRSGARVLPELFRLVPGMQSYQINSNAWSVSARGNNSAFSSKQLVLIDGRAAYSPFLGSAEWDTLNLILEDIERIEVIRGPGAAMWGNNSVNGVINIITRSSKVTHGGYSDVVMGSYEKGTASFRYGGQLPNSISYRVYFQNSQKDSFENPNSSLANPIIPVPSIAYDDWRYSIAGLRTDWSFNALNSLMLKADVFDNTSYSSSVIYDGLTPTVTRGDADKNGFNLHGKWSHTFKNNSESILQFWYERYDSSTELSAEERDVWNLEFQHTFDISNRTGLVWGLNYRKVKQLTEGRGSLSFSPENNLDLYSAFAHINYQLVPSLWELSLSNRIEHNDIEHFSQNPSVRISYTPSDTKSYWASLSQSNRFPSIAEQSTIMTTPGFQFTGNNDLTAEKVISFELGHKKQLSNNANIDVTVFTNYYDNAIGLISADENCIGAVYQGCRNTTMDNQLKGNSHGLELAVNWQAKENWLLKLSYSKLKINMKTKINDSELEESAKNIEGSSSPNVLSLISRHDLANNWKLDGWLRYNDHLPAKNIGSLVTMGVNLSKQIGAVTYSLNAKNIFDSQHPEYSDSLSGYVTTEVPRSIYGMISWKF